MDITWVIYHLAHNDEDFGKVELEIDYYDEEIWGLLMISLSQNTTLQSLQMSRAEAEEVQIRSPNEVNELFEYLRQLPNLREIELVGFSPIPCQSLLFEDNETLEKIRLVNMEITEEFLETIASATRLRRVELEVTTSTPLAGLIACPTLEELTVESYGCILEDEHFIPMVEELCDNESLKEMDLDYEIEFEGSVALATMLKSHNRTLQKLHFAFDGGNVEDEESDVFCELMLEALEQNDGITQFKNYHSNRINMGSNMRRKQLDMLEKNMTLLSFNLFDDYGCEKTKMFLKLNKSGRRRLFDIQKIASKKDWIDAMAFASDSLDCMYYYLSMNPSLCRDCFPSKSAACAKRCCEDALQKYPQTSIVKKCRTQAL